MFRTASQQAPTPPDSPLALRRGFASRIPRTQASTSNAKTTTVNSPPTLESSGSRTPSPLIQAQIKAQVKHLFPEKSFRDLNQKDKAQESGSRTPTPPESTTENQSRTSKVKFADRHQSFRLANTTSDDVSINEDNTTSLKPADAQSSVPITTRLTQSTQQLNDIIATQEAVQRRAPYQVNTQTREPNPVISALRRIGNAILTVLSGIGRLLVAGITGASIPSGRVGPYQNNNSEDYA